jgi:hypothetical protein
MSHTERSATRWPLNFTHAEVTIRGVTPEGVMIEIVAKRIKFASPHDIAMIEVQPVDPEPVSDKTIGQGPCFMLDLRGTFTTLDPKDPLYELSVAQPEDGERLIAPEPPKPDPDWPSGWTDPKDWA